jgi:RND family efflux transporter MFP subunit
VAPIDESEKVSVRVFLPVEREVVDFEDFTGRTAAVESVEIRSRVTGYLRKVCFHEGAEVKKGDLLFEIDPRPFQAKHDQTLAQIKLREADLTFRKAELDRNSRLLDKNAVSRSDYDQSLAMHSQATAAVAAAQASAEETKLDLEFTRLYSPIDGEISRAHITQGNLVNADQTLLTTIVSVDPMYVYFDIDEPTALRLAREIREGKTKVRDIEQVPIWMKLADEEGFSHEGFLNFAENRVDSDTGTIEIRGVFKNPKPARGGRVLTPGLFVRVHVPVSEPYKAILVPERALMTDQGQKYLLIVNEKNQVEDRPVTLGQLEGGMRVIRGGLQPTEHVIISRLQYVRPGMTVVPQLVDKPS